MGIPFTFRNDDERPEAILHVVELDADGAEVEDGIGERLRGRESVSGELGSGRTLMIEAE